MSTGAGKLIRTRRLSASLGLFVGKYPGDCKDQHPEGEFDCIGPQFAVLPQMRVVLAYWF
jgi:hypothetical protein